MKVPSMNAIFFNGDRVRGTGNTVIERLSDIEKIGEIIVSKLGENVNVWVIEASKFNGSFAVYKDFIPSVNKWGEPTSYDPTGFPASTSIVSLLSTSLTQERTEIRSPLIKQIEGITANQRGIVFVEVDNDHTGFASRSEILGVVMVAGAQASSCEEMASTMTGAESSVLKGLQQCIDIVIAEAWIITFTWLWAKWSFSYLQKHMKVERSGVLSATPPSPTSLDPAKLHLRSAKLHLRSANDI
ncbi:hypothetical protein L2E82_48989 [Cichorium intybus]|uniref:Uncharacterized protein n=1 Tax=Cichorium intybus TaxID=13427 RepID=A0ACB8YZ24_CICIN|nr:hypothetical protein L2E82_48989 [Cichorium intybus]